MIWLGTAKNRGFKEEQSGSVQCGKEGNRALENLDMSSRGEDMDGSINQESDLDSPLNSPTSATSSVLGGADSSTNFTGSGGSGSSSSSSSGGCCSGCITEDEEGGGEDDDGCLDDWEAVADALAADEDKPQGQNPSSESESVAQVVSPREVTDGMGLGGGNSKPECPKMASGACGNSRAWRPDDAFRPRSLPNLSKQQSLPNPDRHYGGGGVAWASKSVVSAPSSCPICYEELDLTDSSFLPCLCGFRLCLFCHKRIVDEDGRCPGCRKPYETKPIEAEASVNGGSLTFRLARSCSMITRS